MITQANFTQRGTPLTPAQISELLTIEQLFYEIQRAIRSNAAVLSVAYNVEFGYPESIYIDQAANIADDEITHMILNFRPNVVQPANLDQRRLDHNMGVWENAAIDTYQYIYIKR